jgi:hypothetical protein
MNINSKDNYSDVIAVMKNDEGWVSWSEVVNHKQSDSEFFSVNINGLNSINMCRYNKKERLVATHSEGVIVIMAADSLSVTDNRTNSRIVEWS